MNREQRRQLFTHRQAIVDFGIGGLNSDIQSIALFHTQALGVHKSCELQIETQSGEVPEDRAGMGPIAANAVLNTVSGSLNDNENRCELRLTA